MEYVHSSKNGTNCQFVWFLVWFMYVGGFLYKSTMRWVDNNIYDFAKTTTKERHCHGIHKNRTIVV